MSAQHKNNHAVAKAIVFVLVVLSGVASYIAHFAHGHNAAPLNPKGTIAVQQLHLMMVSAAIILAVAVPTVALLYFIAWKYRASSHAAYKPEDANSKTFVFSIWAIPTAAMLILALILIPMTRHLDPKKSAAADGKAPMTIQVVALRWKWLFLYPDQQIATVNTVTIPKDQPVQFELTADDTPMSSFWIPNLAGQLYAMTGHVNHLNVVGSQIGVYPGSSAEINGKGFAGMKFQAHVTSQDDFKTWVNQVKATSANLTSSSYDHLMQPSEDEPAANYSGYADDLYNTVIMKYMGSHGSHSMSNDMSGMNMSSMSEKGHM